MKNNYAIPLDRMKPKWADLLIKEAKETEMKPSNYVCAGFETLSGIADRFIKGSNYGDHFTREDINRFFSNTCNKFLHSFGQNFRGKNNYKNYKKSEATLFTKCRETGLFNESIFFTDSGGFQASIGLLDKKEFNTLYTLYYEFLQEYTGVFDRAFILDPVPGPGCLLFDTMDDVERMNNESYLTALNMPKEVRDKIIYIHHFRTPKLWDIFTKILVENDMFSYFKHFATGGIVANQGSDTQIPCIVYTIPLVPLLKQAKNHKFKTLNFHILGGATYRDILFYELFKKHVNEQHGIELNITFDSSGLFKGLMQARTVNFLEGKIIRKMDLKSSILNEHVSEISEHKSENTILETFRFELQDLARKHNFKVIPVNDLYSEETGTFPEEIRIYSMLYMLDFYARVQTILKEEAERIYSIFKSGDMLLFGSELERITRNINGNKISRKQTAKTQSVIRSLNMLTDLDEDFCRSIVVKYLAKDEFTELTHEYRVEKF